jgi:serine/threonine-protein kinase CLA4
MNRQDTAPPGLETKSYSNRGDYANGGNVRGPAAQLQATRPAPPRPQIQGQSSRTNVPKAAQNNAGTSQRTGDTRGPREQRDIRDPRDQREPRDLAPTKSRERDREDDTLPREREPQNMPIRKDSIANERPLPQPTQQQLQQRQRDREREREREQRDRVDREREQAQSDAARPPMAPAKSMTANTTAATDPAPGPAGALAGPPPIKPLQTAKKLPPVDSPAVAAAAAALEKPAPLVEKRWSAMTEAQIMDKLRSVVNQDDPKTLYTTIKKIGQGYVLRLYKSSVYT